MIGSGEAEIAIAGGADAPITPLTTASFIAAGLISFHNGDPAKASRPFDGLRQCGVLAEGSCVMVLENLERAQARGVRTYVEITGFSKQRDQDPHYPASGLEQSMTLALSNAGLSRDDIDYISAYGPGDRILDAAEVVAIKRVFKDRAYSIPITSIKGVTGNALAAGGPFQVAACALSVRDQLLSPTANYEVLDPECDLDFVPRVARRGRVNHALVNVRGLGRGASSMVIGRVASYE
jgi:3-oxoacyl-(acyl-carrier-protein) synthase